MSSSRSSPYGMMVGLFTVIFVGLKITDNTDCSWWWVLSPIWISFILIILAATIVAGAFAGKKK